MKKPKILELDIVRAFAISAVLLIHGTAEATVEIPSTSRSQIIYDAVNKLSYFAVPVFILLSGLVLFYSYIDTWKLGQALSFYRKRLQFILIPYLVWSFFYYIYNPAVTPDVPVHVDPLEFLQLIRWADTGYHLYFMIIIMQFYALFPLMITAAKRWGWFGRYLWLIGLIIQAAAYLYNHYVEPIPHRPSLCVTYFGLFCVGASIGMHYETFIAWLNRNIWWVTAFTTAIGFTFMMMYVISRFGVHYGQTPFEVMFNTYAVFAAISFVWIGRHLLEARPALAAWLRSMGAASFGIYFIHPALLTAWRIYLQASPDSPAYHAFTLGGMLLIFSVPWLVVSVLKRVKASWLLFGK